MVMKEYVDLDDDIRMKKQEEELIELRKSNEELLSIASGLLKTIKKLKAQIENNTNDISDLKNAVMNLPYEINDPLLVNQLFYPKILSADETVRMISEDGKSICRFGDGEYDLILGYDSGYRFQRSDSRLGERLKEVLNSSNDNVLIAIAGTFGTLREYNWKSQSLIRRDYVNKRAMYESMLSRNRVYGEAMALRPSSISEACRLKKIWEGKQVLIIEGDKTRTGIGNDLLANGAGIRRIICPSANAFDYYEKILKSAVRYAGQEDIILISLGPTASVLAYDLAVCGFHSVDFGHADVAYDHLMGVVNFGNDFDYEKGPMRFKDCSDGGNDIDRVDRIPSELLSTYKDQIADVIGTEIV